MISGFLSPEGEYTFCGSYCHIETAVRICDSKYPAQAKLILHDYDKEDFLIKEKRYIKFDPQGCTFFSSDGLEFYQLTSQQREFLEDIEPNNHSQAVAIANILSMDDELKEDFILARIEEQINGN